MKKEIVALVGSLRKESYNYKLALKVKELLNEEEVNLNIVDIKDIPLFNEDIEYPAPSAVTRLREEIKSADALLIFTPEYNHYFPGVLKNVLDWLSRPISKEEGYVLNKKKVAFAGASTGMNGTALAQDHLVTLLNFLNMDVMNTPRLTIPFVHKQVDNNGNVDFNGSLTFIKMFINAFLAFINE